MKIKKVISILLCFAMVLLSSGCSLNFFSVESLMSPPAQSGKNGEVEKAFKKLMAEKTIQLRTPQSGDYQTAFVLFDVNADEQEEAIVFYTDSAIDTSVRMAFMECINDTWVISADIKGAGSGIFDVDFSDMDNDGIYEILVGWTLFDTKTSKIASVYEVAIGETGVFTLNTLGNEYYNFKTRGMKVPRVLRFLLFRLFRPYEFAFAGFTTVYEEILPGHESVVHSHEIDPLRYLFGLGPALQRCQFHYAVP